MPPQRAEGAQPDPKARRIVDIQTPDGDVRREARNARAHEKSHAAALQVVPSGARGDRSSGSLAFAAPLLTFAVAGSPSGVSLSRSPVLPGRVVQAALHDLHSLDCTFRLSESPRSRVTWLRPRLSSSIAPLPYSARPLGQTLRTVHSRLLANQQPSGRSQPRDTTSFHPRGFSPPRRFSPVRRPGILQPVPDLGFAVLRIGVTWPTLDRSRVSALRRCSHGAFAPFEDFTLVGSRTASLRPLPPCRCGSRSQVAALAAPATHRGGPSSETAWLHRCFERRRSGVSPPRRHSPPRADDLETCCAARVCPPLPEGLFRRAARASVCRSARAERGRWLLAAVVRRRPRFSPSFPHTRRSNSRIARVAPRALRKPSHV